MRRLIYLLILCLLPLGSGMAANSFKYNTLRLGQANDHVKVVFDLSGPTQYKYFTLEKPDRLVIDLMDVVRQGGKPRLNYKNTPIKNIRTGIRKGDDLRVVMELNKRVPTKVYSLKPSAANKHHRLVVELKHPRPVVAKAVPTKPQSAVRKQPAPVVKKTLQLDHGRDIIVAIDAGHGGVDPGAKGHKGTYEKEVVLQIARKLEALVEKEEGMRPLMIRDGDYFIKLGDRIKKARENKADIFISIHADAFPDARARGASVYTLSSRGAATTAAKMLANRENSADLVGGVTISDKDDMLAGVLLDLSQSATNEASYQVGNRVLKGLKSLGKTHKKKVEQASFAVLKSPDVPSILIETAFISNPQEERNLRSQAYQQRLAKAMLGGIRSYFAANPPPGTRIAARAQEREQEHVIQRGETLSGIASRYRVKLATLKTANRLKSDMVRVGQVIQIPTRGG